MEHQDTIDNPSIGKGRFLISFVIGLFIFGETVSLFMGSFNLVRILLYSLLLFLVYEGYDWARILYGFLLAIAALFGMVAILLGIQANISWGMICAGVLLTLSFTGAASILFFSNDAHAFLKTRKKQSPHPPVEIQKQSRLLPPYHELSEQVRARFSGELPTYEITIALPIPNSNDQIILMKFLAAFRNVFRCDPNGSVIWQAELPTETDDVYTNIEWKENQLRAFSRSCVSVILDVESGKILSPKGAT